MNPSLLVELLTEELPPHALRRLSQAFTAALVASLHDHRLIAGPGADGATTRAFATPRRLAVRIDDVAEVAADHEQLIRGPSLAVGLDPQGQPTVALRKWAERQGVAIEALERVGEGRQAAFQGRVVVAGARLESVIGPLVEAALAALPIPRLMTYQLADGRTTVSFARPAQGLVVLHGRRVLPCRVLGLDAGRQTRGHRFLAAAPVTIDSAEGYESALDEVGHVIASFERRRTMIDAALRSEAGRLQADLVLGQAIDTGQYEALVEEVTALVEQPAIYVGRFDERFLTVPPECLILTLRTHQRVFPLFGRDRRLLPKFLIVSNLPVDDPSNIVDGNERVVRARLADARFFFEQDQRQTLASRLPRLASVTYHARLGSQADRAARIARIGRAVTELLAAATMAGAPVAAAAPGLAAEVDRAAALAKADLLTGMVGEFPELQGIMGRYYARHDGEPDGVAEAIAEHYQPRFAGDALPLSATGQVLALADKLETLAGIWGIGQQPTGDRDPFALRRHALGVIRLLCEHRLALSLDALLDQAFGALVAVPSVKADPGGLRQFIAERLRGYLRDRGHRAEDIDAVIASDVDRLDQVMPRLEAVAAVRARPEFEALAAANKRIANILRKSGPGGPDVDPARLVEPAERALHAELQRTVERLVPLMAARDYGGALEALAALREPVDRFFDQVLVNADDAALRDNRLALLVALHRALNRVADLSRL
jgi:glycyl-tRNA synthetase beta chain